MATFGTAIRRGLPRVPGGEPWPPGGDPGAVQVAGIAGSTQATRQEATPEQGVIAAAAVQVAETAASEAGTTRVATPEQAGAPGAYAAGGIALRRGLPRTPGGDPWPPAGAGPASLAPLQVAGTAGSASTTPQDATPERAVAAATVIQVTETAGSAPGTPQSVTPEREAGVALRRGLPRAAGGEPWPPAGLAPVLATAGEVGADTSTPSSLSASAAPVTVADAPPTPTPTPAPVADTGAVAATEAAASVVPASTSAGTPSGVPLSVPLPFPRTVWPGKTAFTRPSPKPEPERIGPFTRLQWAGAVIVAGGGLLFAAGMLVLFVRWLLSLPVMVEFITAFPGEYHLPEGAPVGIPPWLGWQHFFNVFLIVLIIRSGLQVRTEKRPTVFWSPRSNGKRKISLNLWFHQSLDILWIVNGVIFVVLLFVTGQWMKIVPTSWEVFPNAISAGLQYVSLDWPTENGWVNYNSLQQLAYFTTVFLAAPLAIATGVRMSGIWPSSAKTLNRAYPVEWARAIHFPVMIYFVLFILVHVALVFATGALRNLNHMYASQDAVNWTGFWIFAASMLIIAAGWIAARPLILAPIARLFGKVSGR